MEDKTDIVGNDVIIELLRNADGVRGQLRQAIPAKAFPAYAHELTHHWCFLSPIGAAVATLWAQSNYELWRAKSDNDAIKAAADRVFGMALSAAYAPIAEGLALFAQNDMRMGIGGLSVEPCEWVTQDFVGFDEKIKEKMLTEFQRIPDPYGQDAHTYISDELHARFVQAVNGFLDAERLTEHALHERVRVSQRRLDSGDGGYLPGYLLIRRGYNRLRRESALAVDPNSFLAYAKQYFFHDTVLACSALNRPDNADFQLIIARLEERISKFDAPGIADTYRVFVRKAETERRQFAWGRWASTFWGPLGLPRDGDEQVFSAIRGRLQRAGVSDRDAGIEQAVFLFRVTMRDFVQLGSVTGRLTSGGFTPDPRYGMSALIMLPVKPGTVHVDGPATIDLLLWSPGNRRVFALYKDFELINHVIHKDGVPDEMLAMVEASLQQRRALLENSATMSTHATEIIQKVFVDLDKSIAEDIAAELDKMLSRLLFAGHSDIDGVFSRLRNRGFFELYDTSDRALQYARICAESGSGREPDRSDLDNVLSWAERTRTMTGWPLIERAGDQLLTAL